MIHLFLAYAVSISAAAQGAPIPEPLKDLTVALYHGAQTRESVHFLSDYYRNEAPYQVRDNVDNAGRFMSEAGSAVTRPFGGSVSVERPEEAARAGADLVAVLEAQAAFKRDLKLTRSARVRLAVEFRDLSGRRIAAMESESIRAPMAEGRVRIRNDLYREFAQALDEAAALLEGRVRKSPELAAYAAQASRTRAAAKPEPAAAVSSDADRAAYRLPVESSALALVVGVDRYDDGSQAAYAERDAAAMRAQLIGLGWPDDNVFWLTGRRAELAEVRKALAACKRRGPGAAKAFFYFSGLTQTDPQGRAERKLRDGALGLDELLSAAAGLGAGAALVVLDAPAALDQAAAGVAALAGAGPKEERIVDTRDGHGLFTLEFIRALTGAADKDGKVTLRAAFARAAADVKSASGGVQTPVLAAPEGWDPILVPGASGERR